MTTRHKTTKIEPGVYLYRGYTITRTVTRVVTPIVRRRPSALPPANHLATRIEWRITPYPPGSDPFVPPQRDTLRGAKGLLDYRLTIAAQRTESHDA